MIGSFLGHDRPVVCITGLCVHRACACYRGEGETGAEGAFVVVGRACVRREVGALRSGDGIAVGLRIVTSGRRALVAGGTCRMGRLGA